MLQQKLKVWAMSLGLALLAILAVSQNAFAFGGCVVSPENPTLVLVLIGAVAAGLPFVRAHINSRLKKTEASLDRKRSER